MALPLWFRVCASLLFALTLSFTTAAQAAEADVRRIWQLLVGADRKLSHV
jgi:hypothetical protein